MKIETLGAIAVFALLNAGCVTEGIDSVEPASREEQAEANLALGIGYLREDRPDLAIDALARAIDILPRSADAHSALAIAYDQTGSTELAEEHHRRAADLAPSNANTQNGYAVFLCRQNRWQEARPYFVQAIEVSNGAAAQTAMANAAVCARGAGDLDAAGTYFRSILAVDPSNTSALRGMIDISIRSGNYNSGRAFWQRLQSSSSVMASDLLSCYVIESGLGDSSAAQDCANRLRQEFPGAPETGRLRELERNAG
jgi:type IV pilus assembly protein PilF